jgi:hypothetical protein
MDKKKLITYMIIFDIVAISGVVYWFFLRS